MRTRRGITLALLCLFLVLGGVYAAQQMTRQRPKSSGTNCANTTELTAESGSLPSSKSPFNYDVSQGWFGSYLGDPRLPSPVGIASYSYGLLNLSGALRPFVVDTGKVVATIRIDSLTAYNSSLPTVYQHGASLQLNVMLAVNTTAGAQFFWLQNTNRFDTADGVVNSPRDLIFNDTGQTGNLILNLQGGRGDVEHPSTGQTSYIYGSELRRYSLPLCLTVATSVETLPGMGVRVAFYNRPLGGGYFDNVTIAVPSVTSAAIVISPSQVPANPVTFDAELVWVAYCCGYPPHSRR